MDFFDKIINEQETPNTNNQSNINNTNNITTIPQAAALQADGNLFVNTHNPSLPHAHAMVDTETSGKSVKFQNNILNFNNISKQGLRIGSLNVNSLTNKMPIVNDLLHDYNLDILFIQETWLYDLAVDAFKGYKTVHISAMEPDRPVVGRCYGGIAIIVRDDIKFERVTPPARPDNLSVFNYSRCLSLDLCDYSICVTNLYLPCSAQGETVEEASCKLHDLLGYYHSYTDDFTNKIIGGDFNSSPYDDNFRSKILDDLIKPTFHEQDINILPANSYSYESAQNGSKRLLDRILSTTPDIFSSYKIHTDTGAGLSDHYLITGTLKIKKITKKSATIKTSKPNWKKAGPKHIRAFNENLSRRILKLEKLGVYNNDTMQALSSAIDLAAEATIPKFSGSNKKKSISKWSELIKPYKTEFEHWCNIELNTDKNLASYDYVSYMKRKSKCRYKLAVKKRRQEISKNIAEQKTMTNCFDTTKKSKIKMDSPPLLLEQKSPEDQLELWNNHYNKVFKGRNEPKTLPDKYKISKGPVFTLTELDKVISDIDTKKSYNHHFAWKHLSIRAKKLLLSCYNNWSSSESQDWDFLATKISPIPKGPSKPTNIIKSYRPIACATSEAWILEKLVRNLAEPYFTTKPEQFGYKAGHSTIHCLSIVKQLRFSSDVHIAFLDASSAFDKISHERIIAQLEKRKVPAELIKSILGLTFNTNFKITWFSETTTNKFYPGQGVKQGGCLSAFLFAICYDDLIENIKKTPGGVWMNKYLLQIIIFADDICICATSSNGLSSLYNEVMRFCNLYGDIEMNPSKSVIMRLGTSKQKAISFQDIPTKEKATYLGATISNSKNDEEDKRRTIRTLYIKTNMLLKQNSQVRYLANDQKKQILNAYGTVYGIETFENISSTQNRAHAYMTKNLWPKYQHSEYYKNGFIRYRFLYKLIANDANTISERHRALRNKFILKCRNSDNPLLSGIIGGFELIAECDRELPSWMKKMDIWR